MTMGNGGTHTSLAQRGALPGFWADQKNQQEDESEGLGMPNWERPWMRPTPSRHCNYISSLRAACLMQPYRRGRGWFLQGCYFFVYRVLAYDLFRG